MHLGGVGGVCSMFWFIALACYDYYDYIAEYEYDWVCGHDFQHVTCCWYPDWIWVLLFFVFGRAALDNGSCRNLSRELFLEA